VSDGDERGTSERPSEQSRTVSDDDAGGAPGPTEVEPVETPLLRIITPDTTPEEVAAIVAVLSALGTGEATRPRPVTEWNSPYRQVRPFYSHGPGGWRSSGLPKHRGRGN
jgi:hypothetical protein